MSIIRIAKHTDLVDMSTDIVTPQKHDLAIFQRLFISTLGGLGFFGWRKKQVTA